MNFSRTYINAATGISPIGYSSIPLQRIHTQIFLYSPPPRHQLNGNLW